MARETDTDRIAFGGGCHWCTEAVFQQLRGVEHVDQGWASATDAPARYSEAVVVTFRPREIPLAALIQVHLHTHSCTSPHPMRGKYRSAVYGFGESQMAEARSVIAAAQADFERPIITEVVRFSGFRQNTSRYQDYYLRNPGAPFCERYISPKLEALRRRFAERVR